MPARRRTHVHAPDPVTAAGLTARLAGHPLLELVEPGPGADADSVAVVAVHGTGEDALALVRRSRAHGCRRVVLVCSSIDERDLLAALDLGVAAVLPRSEASTHRLVHAVLTVAAGDTALPADLLGRLLERVVRLHDHVLTPRPEAMAEREVRVLSLVADGLDTREIARELCYSERTVKNVLHAVTTRLQLRNRSQAVAYAVRAGII